MRRPCPAFLSCAVAAATVLTPPLVRADAAGALAGQATDRGAQEDPNADRGMILPTALTQPKNTLTVSDYDIFMLGLTVGITDRVQVGAATMLVGGGFFFPSSFMVGSLKWQFLRVGNLRLAALAGALYDSTERHDGLPGEGGGHTSRALRPQAGLIGSFCLDTECHSLVSGNAIVSPSRSTPAFQTATVLYSGGATLQLSSYWKLLFEYSQSSTLSRSGLDSTDPTLALGFRLYGRRLAGEIGAMVVINDSGDALPMPFLSVTARL